MFIILLLLNFLACTRPSTRVYDSNSSNSNPVEIIYTTEGTNETSSSSGQDGELSVQEESGATTDFESSIASNPDIVNCTWSSDGINNFVYSHESIGFYNICFVSGKNKVYIQLKSPKTSGPICLFPTTSYENGGSTYIGDAACNNVSSNMTIYPIQFYKNRTGYESATISGTMIMYDIPHSFSYPYYGAYQIPNAYLICMQALYTSLLYSSNADTTWCDTFAAEAQYVYHLFQ
jgi:hypothetical protein